MPCHLWYRILSALKSPEMNQVVAYVSEGFMTAVTEAEKL